MKNRWTKFTVISLIIVLVMSLGAVALFAQDNTTPDTPTRPAVPFGHGGFHGRGHGGINDEALAGALGITVAELEAARQKVADDRLAQAVADGYLTQEQVDLMQAKRALKGSIDQQEILLQALGLSAEKFAEAREKGSLRELLAGITPAELRERMQTATEEAIQNAVVEGAITQDQANLIIAKMENGLGTHGKFGGHHGFGGRRGGSHRFHGAPQGNASGEAFTPFRSFQSATTFDA